MNRNKQGLYRTLFNGTRQHNIHIFDKIIFFRYRTIQTKTTETDKEYNDLNRNGSLIQVPLERKGRKGNVLFNDALNTFYLRLYGVGHMVEHHSDIERGNPLPPHGLLFPINSNSKGYFICTIPQT